MNAAPLRRRTFLGAAPACLFCTSAGRALAALAAGGVVDVHFHLLPPDFLRDAPPSAAAIKANPKAMAWSPAAAVQEMDRLGVGRAIISFPQPAMWSDDPEAQRQLARSTNDYYAQVSREHPGRFGLFAGLPPLTDSAGALAEAARGLDSLGADGVRIMTSYQDRWLGDPAFEPVWRELDRRGTVVFVHPDIAACCRNLTSVPFGYAELPLDTARTAASLWYGGVLERWPNIRFILSHGGGALPMIAGRLDGFGRPGPGGGGLTHDAVYAFRRLYVDTANATGPAALAGLRALAPSDRVLFGSDAPFVDIAPQLMALRAAGLSDAEFAAITRGNAERLLT
ncbi:MAG: amidohydrolase family protein, partial [Phenylobacterium sp.]